MDAAEASPVSLRMSTSTHVVVASAGTLSKKGSSETIETGSLLAETGSKKWSTGPATLAGNSATTA